MAAEERGERHRTETERERGMVGWKKKDPMGDMGEIKKRQKDRGG